MTNNREHTFHIDGEPYKVKGQIDITVTKSDQIRMLKYDN